MTAPFVPPGDHPSDRIRALFLSSFSVMDLAEPLVSFDEDASAPTVRAFLEERAVGLVGVRREGLVAAFAFASDLDAGRLGDHAREFGPDDLVPATASLPDAIASLDANGRCFVSILGRPEGIVTFRELDKPAVRMWLFGMITMLETYLARSIRETWPEGSWAALLSPGRRSKAEQLLEERRRRGHPGSLIDCLQLADKGGLLTRRREFLARTRFSSKREADEAFQRIQALRNGLAHALPSLVSTDWKLVVQLARSVDILASIA
ncbi:MAG: hypothetical protein IPL90_03985 [Holophagales bacterium]|nr:hypothetical protein [Holophagales bacterium]